MTGSVSVRNWTIDGAEVAAGAVMHVTGDLTFPAGATFTLINHAAVPENGKAVTIATVDGTVSGLPAPLTIPGSGVWNVYPSGKDLKQGLLKGTLLILK